MSGPPMGFYYEESKMNLNCKLCIMKHQKWIKSNLDHKMQTLPLTKMSKQVDSDVK